MQTGTRARPASGSLSGEALALVLRVARGLGISVEISAGPVSRREPLHLAPTCSSCLEAEPRTFDRCRKRRAYLSRRAVPVAVQLAEKCPLGMRLVRRGAPETAPGTTLFAFGLPGGDAAEDHDTSMHAFLAALSALVERSAPDAADSAWAASMRCMRAAGDDLPVLRPEGGRQAPAPGSMRAGAEAWRTDLLLDLVASFEARTPGMRGHALRVRVLARLLGETLGLAGDSLAGLEWAAQLHDVVAVGGASVRCARAPRLDKRAVLQFLPPAVWDRLQPQGLAGRCLHAADRLETRFAGTAGSLPQRLQASLASLAAAPDVDPDLATALGRIEPLLAEHLWIFHLQH